MRHGPGWGEIFAAHFTTGQLHGYFGGTPPHDFFELVAFYTSSRTLLAIEWAIPHGRDEIDFVEKLIKDILSWHDNMINPVPSWYLGNLYTI